MDEQRPSRKDEIRSLLGRAMPPEELRRLSLLSSRWATWSVLKTWGLVAATLAIALRFPHPAVLLGAVLVLAAQQHALAVLAHEAAHHRLYGTRWLNEAIGKLCGYAVGVSLLSYRQVHLAHHQHLYTERDPDMAIMAGYPRGRGYLIRKLLQDLCGLTTLKNLRYVYGGKRPRAEKPEKTPLQAEPARDRLYAGIFQLGLLGLALVSGQWLAYALWLGSLLTVYQVLLRIRALYEHAAPQDTGSPLRAARTNLAGPLARFFLFPHEVYYHIEHHLFPSIPHYRLAEAHRALLAAGALEDAEVAHGLGGTWKKIYARRAAGNS